MVAHRTPLPITTIQYIHVALAKAARNMMMIQPTVDATRRFLGPNFDSIHPPNHAARVPVITDPMTMARASDSGTFPISRR